jgi:hypothetical protein
VPGKVGHDNRVKLEFAGANPRVSIDGVDRLQAESNYLLGKDVSKYLRHVPNYSDVRYEDLYPGIRLDFYGNGQQLEHDFTVAPGASPATIVFHFEGAKSTEIGSSGDLVVRMDEGDLRLKKPYAYQTIGKGRRPVEVSFAPNHDGRIGFHVGSL